MPPDNHFNELANTGRVPEGWYHCSWISGQKKGDAFFAEEDLEIIVESTGNLKEEEMKSARNTMCPICASEIKSDEIAIQYMKNGQPALGHPDCIAFLSKQEERKHPPA